MSEKVESFRVVADVLRAISHPMRIAIMEFLHDSPEPVCVTTIHKALNIEQSVASHHLNVLRNSNVVIKKRNGKFVYYSLNRSTVQHLLDFATDWAQPQLP